MTEQIRRRYGAASGFGVAILGVAATVFERAPVTAADFAANRAAPVTQSMLFLAGAGMSLWFLGSLRTYLTRSEGGSGLWLVPATAVMVRRTETPAWATDSNG